MEALLLGLCVLLSSDEVVIFRRLQNVMKTGSDAEVMQIICVGFVVFCELLLMTHAIICLRFLL